MRTPPMIKMPRPLNITRARCAEAAYRDYPGSEVVPMEWTNYLSSYLWDFSNAVNTFFSYIYIDMRYGNVIFKNPNATYAVSGETVVNVPDWGPFISAKVSFGELAFSVDGFKINIKDTKSESPALMEIGVDVYEDVGVAEAGDVEVVLTTTTFWTTTEAECAYLSKGGSSNEGWIEAYLDYLGDTPTVVENIVLNTISIIYRWDYNVGTTGWDMMARRAYVSFDTSALAGKTVVAAELRLDFDEYVVGGIDTPEQDRRLNLYKKDWGDALDVDDWDVGDGVLISTTDQPASGAQPRAFALSPSDINTEGSSRFMLANKADVDEDAREKPPIVPYDDPKVLYGDPSGYIGGIAVYFDEDRTAQFQPALVVTWR